jgi:hypothetical protein
VGRQLITIGFDSSTSRFRGVATSPTAECREHRVVQLFRKTTSGSLQVGTATTGPQGGWYVEIGHPHGEYFALAPKQTLMGATCPRARSRLLTVL